ncbi:hypothetical protein DFH07DRAFT_974861 [Mycena maculata]|uniref:Uncharacterized protein n=1 Tax=Mycena maculata TaxID=230809 RepID=A0AAD7H5J9_9AGAR|nr:hypothetical protein DFH07DRAFT_974861 [Mycena maculata]
MRRTRAFHLWRAQRWREQVGRRELGEGPQLEGETAYALRQAGVQMRLADRCAAHWKDLPDLIRRGRAGEVVEEGGESDEEEESDGEEEEPIPLLPPREVKSTYVDEVLAM